ncbi:MAG: hypothetical protein KDJ18_02715 [Hyphomicrobiaceae bacterium]|nr:hypothetical protein [Hyphomicrobiaceae bacterium]
MTGMTRGRAVTQAGLAGLMLVLQLAPIASVAADTCQRTDFEAVVDEAAAALRDLNQQNRPVFQEKLRELKDKRGWSHDEFLTAAVPFVKDDKIEVYDQTSAELLDEIASLGQEGAEAATPDCARLEDLRTRMSKLVSIQNEKWTYMFDKLQKSLGQ